MSLFRIEPGGSGYYRPEPPVINLHSAQPSRLPGYLFAALCCVGIFAAVTYADGERSRAELRSVARTLSEQRAVAADYKTGWEGAVTETEAVREELQLQQSENKRLDDDNRRLSGKVGTLENSLADTSVVTRRLRKNELALLIEIRVLKDSLRLQRNNYDTRIRQLRNMASNKASGPAGRPLRAKSPGVAPKQPVHQRSGQLTPVPAGHVGRALPTNVPDESPPHWYSFTPRNDLQVFFVCVMIACMVLLWPVLAYDAYKRKRARRERLSRPLR